MLIAPSILSADFLHLGDQIRALEQTQADYIHIDVMDGHFVPNLTFGPVIIKQIKKATKLPLDIHLMIDNPQCYIDSYAEAGANILTIHQENTPHLERVIKHIKSLGLKAGVALNPSTPETSLEYIIDQLDLVLIMSVNPGFAGQNFLNLALKKISALKTMLAATNNSGCLLSVDGGIDKNTAQLCAQAGATMLVAGSYVFKSGDIKQAISELKRA